MLLSEMLEKQALLRTIFPTMIGSRIVKGSVKSMIPHKYKSDKVHNLASLVGASTGLGVGALVGSPIIGMIGGETVVHLGAEPLLRKILGDKRYEELFVDDKSVHSKK